MNLEAIFSASGEHRAAQRPIGCNPPANLNMLKKFLPHRSTRLAHQDLDDRVLITRAYIGEPSTFGGTMSPYVMQQ